MGHVSHPLGGGGYDTFQPPRLACRMAFGCGEESDAGCSGASETKNPNEKAGRCSFLGVPTPPPKKKHNQEKTHKLVGATYISFGYHTKIDEIIFDTDFPRKFRWFLVPWTPSMPWVPCNRIQHTEVATRGAMNRGAGGLSLIPGGANGMRKTWGFWGMIFFLVKPIHMSLIKMVK